MREIRLKNGIRKLSSITERTLKQIAPAQNPVATFHAMGSWPLQYRTFGGNYQEGPLCEEQLEAKYSPEYILALLTSGTIIRELLYPQADARHTLYCDGFFAKYLKKYDLLDNGPWDKVDTETLEQFITFENVDHRIYYSICKPFAIQKEIERERMYAERENRPLMPIMFVDSDLILKKPHDAILKNPSGIRAAFGHLETIGTECYPDFRSLHFPKGYQLDEGLRTDLPAVNTCLLYFNDFEFALEWSNFFAELMLENWLDEEPDGTRISQQLLGFDQRTLPMIAAKHGYWKDGNDYWSAKQLEAFLDLEWDGACLKSSKGERVKEWHYYTLEYKPEKTDWMQDITHTWINKRDIECDSAYRKYQCCIMLEMLLALQPDIQPCLRRMKVLESCFALLDTGYSIEQMLEMGWIHDRLNKSEKMPLKTTSSDIRQ